MSDRSANTEMADVRHITPESEHTTSTRSKSVIQFIQNGLKLIEFDDGKRGQAGEPVGKENTMAHIADIPVDVDNNCLPFKNNVEYA